MANVVILLFFSFSLIIYTTSAFYFGETRQANTTFAFFANVTNSSLNEFFPFYVIFDSYSPPNTNAVSLEYPITFYLA